MKAPDAPMTTPKDEYVSPVMQTYDPNYSLSSTNPPLVTATTTGFDERNIPAGLLAHKILSNDGNGLYCF